MDNDHPKKVFFFCQKGRLKHSRRQWDKRFNEFMPRNGYERSEFVICIYFKEPRNGEFICLLIYVDNILITLRNKKQVCELKVLLGSNSRRRTLEKQKKYWVCRLSEIE